MKNWTLVMALILVAFPSHGSAQSRKAVAGTWKLISAVNTDDNGKVMGDAYGKDPTGLITYSPDGRMSVIITWSGRKPLAPVPVSSEARAQAFSTLLAYAGRYTLDGDKVTHHIEVSWIPDWANTEQVRTFKLQGNRLSLSTPPFLNINGVHVAKQELLWERLKSARSGD